MRYHHIFTFGDQWDEQSFMKQAHTFESLEAQIRQMNEFKSELAGFRLNRACGVIHVNGSGLRGSLEPIPERALAAMTRVFASMAREKGLSTSNQLSAVGKALEERPTTPPNYDVYKKVVDAAEAQLEASEKVSFDLEDAWRLLATQGFRASMDDQLQMDALRTRRSDLEHHKLPQARAYLATLPKDPQVFVTVNATKTDVHEWSLTCTSGVSGNELATLRMDLENEASTGFKDALAGRLGVPSERLQLLQADGQLLEEGHSLPLSTEEPPESIASMLRRQASSETVKQSGGSPPRHRSGQHL
jgi:hypothetical protein